MLVTQYWNKSISVTRPQQSQCYAGASVIIVNRALYVVAMHSDSRVSPPVSSMAIYDNAHEILAVEALNPLAMNLQQCACGIWTSAFPKSNLVV